MLLFLICDLLYLSVLLFVPSNLYLSQFNLSKSVFEEPLKRSKKKKKNEPLPSEWVSPRSSQNVLVPLSARALQLTEPTEI